MNLETAKLRLSNVGRQYYRDGFTAGYKAGRVHGDLGRPDIPARGMAGHPQVEVEGIEVDELMAPLLLALWRLGLDTQFSCQGDPDRYSPTTTCSHRTEPRSSSLTSTRRASSPRRRWICWTV